MFSIDSIRTIPPKHKTFVLVWIAIAVVGITAIINSLLPEGWACGVLIVSMLFNWLSIRCSWMPTHKTMVTCYKVAIDVYDLNLVVVYLAFAVTAVVTAAWANFSPYYGALAMIYCMSDWLLFFTLDDQVMPNHP